ncbi:alpha/beta fold hydrolase [Sinosporangium siamense]|uniref:alpha/beta fold hydrolase n=1 Tax=Sinosporangium siamense TaxID=1367973 RepID=UPI001951D1EF|nr:alpha/beta fold hydrolase [Sinosporangium siamense]
MITTRALALASAWLLVLAAVAYSLWVPLQYMNPGVHRALGYLSELGALDQPWSWMARLGDVVAGAACLLAVALVPDPRPGPWRGAGWLGLAVFGAATLADGVFALDCASLSNPECMAREISGQASFSHYVHMATSGLAAAGVLLSLPTLVIGSRRPLIRYGGAAWTLAALVATVWTLVAVVLRAEVGLAQRIQVAVFTLWLLTLAVGLPKERQVRRPAGVHVVREGVEAAPQVVLTSGMAGAWYHWDAVAEQLRGDLTVVRFDRPGLGLSPAPVVPPTLRREAVRLLALTGDTPVVVVAHSVAAWHAEAFARLWPGLVGGVVLLDPSCESRPRRGTSPAGRLLGRALPALGHTLGAVVITRLSGPAAYRLAGGARVDGRAREVYGSARVAAASLGEWLAYRDMADDLTALRGKLPYPAVPTVVITAGRENPCHRDLAAALNAERVVLPDAGHQVHVERPEAVAAAVRHVVEAVQGRQPGVRGRPVDGKQDGIDGYLPW